MCNVTDSQVYQKNKKMNASSARVQLQIGLIDRFRNNGPWWRKGRLLITLSYVPMEMIFSKAGQIISRRRTSLEPSTFDKLALISARISGYFNDPGTRRVLNRVPGPGYPRTRYNIELDYKKKSGRHRKLTIDRLIYGLTVQSYNHDFFKY